MKQNLEEAKREYIEKYVSHNEYARFGEAFIAGANWRINSVWHKTKDEVPHAHGKYEKEHYPQIPCLVYGKLSTGTGYGVRYWNVTEQCWDNEECDDYECSKDAIDEWAYLDDLISTEE